MQDIHAAGGIPAILKTLSARPDVLDLEAPTVTGRTLAGNLEGVVNRNPECIRPLESPHAERGALCSLFGSLAPDGAVVVTQNCVNDPVGERFGVESAVPWYACDDVQYVATR